MRFLLISLLLMATCFYWSTGQANSFEDCCLKYVKVKNPKRVQKNILSYQEVRTGGGCNLHAVILKLRRWTICVNPNENWVKNYIKISKTKQAKSEMMKRCKKHPKFCKNW
ncbi:C-C motif chemokine 25b [Narcine bancroftii]|uniref:C-C motif chemokine 25b n=1 Tax=Narcine bancroftii TaxID=1343680 RepID=UPI0038322DDE